MELWQQIDWQHQLERKARSTFARTFRVKLGKSKVLETIADPLSRSRFWVDFDPTSTVYSGVSYIVDHLVETYGLEVSMKDGALYNHAADRSWPLPDDPKLAAKAMASLKRAEPMLEPRPYVRNGSTDTLGWAVFSSSDWAELEAADVYATHALFPLKGRVPDMPAAPQAEAQRRQREPTHEELLAWIGANRDQLMPQLVDALEKLETSRPESNEERDALSQIYRIERRARR